ncbi:hypothetical protein IVB33_19015 [Bradyrhizobium sp. 24]|nr:hypothetical protein [Bradyrhizobium sp. 24]
MAYFDLAQWSGLVSAERGAMKPPPEEPRPEEPPVKPTRLEARRIIEEYADDLREIIRYLRRKMN